MIAALKKHEIGYHSNWHSVQPTPALYLSTLGWDEGVAEFDRREGPGRDDVERIFGLAPSCYGQPGSSWGPQSYGAMKKWGMGVYLDAGRHVDLDGKPCYYCGVLNLYKLDHILRADLASLEQRSRGRGPLPRGPQGAAGRGRRRGQHLLSPLRVRPQGVLGRRQLQEGANPPRSEWKLPPAKTPEESKIAYQVFENYVRFIKRFPEVRFITASEAAQLYRDRARGRKFSPTDLKAIAATVSEGITFQEHDRYTLSAGEVLLLLNATSPTALPAERLPKSNCRGRQTVLHAAFRSWRKR